MLVPYKFWLSCYYNILIFLISTALRGATLIRRGASMWIPKEVVILRRRHIVEEIVYTIIQ